VKKVLFVFFSLVVVVVVVVKCTNYSYQEQTSDQNEDRFVDPFGSFRAENKTSLRNARLSHIGIIVAKKRRKCPI